ncbi:hypothetical protein PVAND_012684 [Polypedilum vanderplanki]|uniref:Uncharacterized protein n=1 Tax=Polypedilum vanderplanki TaxID=319348 RepID=A0A9J6CNF7_POLVA|nr:hypothetical protein PVAND_012684 [Polypedilum vanderplanki]
MVQKYNIKKAFEKSAQEVQESWFLKSTPFIVCDVFLERYCTAGILTIFPYFFHIKLGLEEDLATSIYHLFEGLMLVFAIFGTIIGETWMGLYQAIVISSLVYVVGLAVISVAMIDSFSLPVGYTVTLGLLITLVGCGCLQNNLNAFGAGQHKLPEQKQQLETYFSVEYFGIKCGSFMARALFPMIRADVKCFGNDDCYSVSFGIPSAIFFIATIVFLCGTGKYTKLKPNGNMLVKVIKVIKVREKFYHQSNVNYKSIHFQHALTNKPNNLPESEQKPHWLEYSEEKYGKKLVMETKIALKVVLMSLPVPIFWACLMQQRSRWIFQATKLDGNLEFYTLEPDQMMTINSFIGVILIPFLDKFIYPLLEKVGIKTTLQRLVFGGVLIAVAFILSTILETQIEKNYISILWQLPQYILIAIAETFTYLSHLNFAYKEAPPSMKPVMMCLICLSMAGGDLIVAVISAISIFPSQAYEFAFYACLTLIDVILLTFLAKNYKPVDHEILKSLENKTNIEK